MPDVDLNDAIALLKTGDTAGAQAMLRRIVGLPPETATPAPARSDDVSSMRGKQGVKLGPGADVPAAAAPPRPTPNISPRYGVATPPPTAARSGFMRRAAPMPMPTPSAQPTMVRPGMGRPDMQQFAKGGSVGSASKRADGCAQRGKTKGKMV